MTALQPTEYRARILRSFVLLFVASGTAARADETVDFQRDILPILSNNCFECHGPDENMRESGLRLDQQESAFAEADSGDPAIVPGQSDESTLLHRILESDPDLRMPPANTGKSLTKEQVAKLKIWIDGGAPWAKHWAFETPVRPVVPAGDRRPGTLRTPSTASFMHA